jgi:hypothetical protein
MKYTLYRYKRIQGAWVNFGAVAFASNKREAQGVSVKVEVDLIHVWLLTDTAPKQVGCGPCGSFPIHGDVSILHLI